MALVPRSSLFDLDRLVDEFFAPVSREGGFFAPRVDVREFPDHYEITAELPGVKKEDLEVRLEDGVLTIEAESRQEEKEEKEGRVLRQERRYGKYLRSFNLGGDVRAEEISATFQDGVLKITVPRVTEQVPARKRIEVK